MQILVTDRAHTMRPETHHIAERRLLYALSRFSSRIRRLELIVHDVNGPRGGIDQHCRLEIRLKPTGEVVISDRDSNLPRCISRLADRAERAVARSLERARQFDRSDSPRLRR